MSAINPTLLLFPYAAALRQLSPSANSPSDQTTHAALSEAVNSTTVLTGEDFVAFARTTCARHKASAQYTQQLENAWALIKCTTKATLATRDNWWSMNNEQFIKWLKANHGLSRLSTVDSKRMKAIRRKFMAGEGQKYFTVSQFTRDEYNQLEQQIEAQNAEITKLELRKAELKAYAQ